MDRVLFFVNLLFRDSALFHVFLICTHFVHPLDQMLFIFSLELFEYFEYFNSSMRNEHEEISAGEKFQLHLDLYKNAIDENLW